jgi:hypothetical protein
VQSYQGRGLAKILKSHLERRVLEIEGVERVRLTTTSANSASLHLYKNFIREKDLGLFVFKVADNAGLSTQLSCWSDLMALRRATTTTARVDAASFFALTEGQFISVNMRVTHTATRGVVPDKICFFWLVIDRCLPSLSDFEHDGVEFFVETDESGRLVSASMVKRYVESGGRSIFMIIPHCPGPTLAVSIFATSQEGFAAQVAVIRERWTTDLFSVMIFYTIELRSEPAVQRCVGDVELYKTYIHDMTCPVLEESREQVLARQK